MKFVTAIHGDESMPVFVLASMGIPQILGNTKALAKGVRYIDNDLNKSFGVKGNSHEEKLAKELLKIINPLETVIDFHTMSAKSEPFVIVVDKKMLPLAKTTGLNKIVFMNFNIKNGHALINYRKGLSIETGLHNDTSIFDRISTIIKNLKKGKTFLCVVYEVFGTIKKPGIYKNFVPHRDGFIPILAGEKAYNFPGLKAHII